MRLLRYLLLLRGFCAAELELLLEPVQLHEYSINNMVLNLGHARRLPILQHHLLPMPNPLDELPDDVVLLQQELEELHGVAVAQDAVELLQMAVALLVCSVEDLDRGVERGDRALEALLEVGPDGGFLLVDAGAHLVKPRLWQMR